MATDRIDFLEVASEIQKLGFAAIVEQTGGGCATLYASFHRSMIDQYVDHWANNSETLDGCPVVAMGPGHYYAPDGPEGFVSGDVTIGFSDSEDYECLETNNSVAIASKIVAYFGKVAN